LGAPLMRFLVLLAAEQCATTAAIKSLAYWQRVSKP